MLGLTKRIAFVRVLAALVFAAACTQAPSPVAFTAPIPTTTVRSDPADLILRLADLPAGFREIDDKPIDRAALSGGEDGAIARDESLRAGFVAGHQRSFSLAADAKNGDRSTNAYLFVFKDPASASTALERSIPADPAFAKTAIGETIGDNSHAYRLEKRGTDGASYDTIIIEFQFGNALSYIAYGGPADGPQMKDARPIAQKQLALLRADVTPIAATGAARALTRAGGSLSMGFDLGLRTSDLPAGFSAVASDELSPEAVSSADLPAEFWDGVGFRGAWGRIFRSEKDNISVTSVVIEVSATRAVEALRGVVARAKDDRIYEISTGVALGDESVAVETHGLSGTLEFTYRSLYFRSGDSVGWVNVRAPRGTLDAPFLIEVTQKLLVRIG